MEHISIEKRLENIEALLVNNFLTNKEEVKWLNIKETCKLLSMSKKTLQTWRDTGLIRFSKIGGKIYFKLSDIDNTLEKHYK